MSTETESRENRIARLIDRCFGGRPNGWPCLVCGGRVFTAPSVRFGQLDENQRQWVEMHVARAEKNPHAHVPDLTNSLPLWAVHTVCAKAHDTFGRAGLAGLALDIPPTRMLQTIVEDKAVWHDTIPAVFQDEFLYARMPGATPEDKPTEPWAHVDRSKLRGHYSLAVKPPTSFLAPNMGSCFYCKRTESPTGVKWHVKDTIRAEYYCDPCGEARARHSMTGGGGEQLLDWILAEHAGVDARPGLAYDHLGRVGIAANPDPLNGIDLAAVKDAEAALRAETVKPRFAGGN